MEVGGLKRMWKELAWSMVCELGERYSFDKEEAYKYLEGKEEGKEGVLENREKGKEGVLENREKGKEGVLSNREKGKEGVLSNREEGKEGVLSNREEGINKMGKGRIVPSLPIPFCGEVKKEWCHGVRLNHGLHTQCTQNPGEGELCKTCRGQAVKNGTGEPTYGRIEARMKHVGEGGKYNTWRDPSGKLVTPYRKVMDKLGITREAAEGEAQKLGWTIPEEHFVVTERSVGRPKKSTAASDTESENGDIAPKRRGRPRKERIVESASEGDDIIAHILADAEQAAEEKEDDSKEGYELCMKRVESEDPDKCRLTELYAEYAPEKVDQVSAILAKRAPGTAARARMWTQLEEKYPGFFKNEPVKDKVSVFVWNKHTYLRTWDNVLYDIETEEEVGVWRVNEQRVEALPSSDFD